MSGSDFASSRARLKGVRYLLVAQPPWYLAPDGAIWLDGPWARDLIRHLDYISKLTVLAPMRPLPDPVPTHLVLVDDRPGLRFCDLPTGGSAREGLRRIPAMLRAAVAAVRAADVVHSGAAGWPVPPGFVVNPAAVALGKPLVIVVESAFWRDDGRPRGRSARIMGWATERLARWSVRRARLAIFTHQGYADDLARNARGRVMVAPASCVDEDDLLTQPAATAAWAAKPSAPRFLLAARLIEAKGILLALQAMERAEAQGAMVNLDIIGDGPLAPQVRALAARLKTARLSLLAPVPYGAEFFEVLSRYHGVVVPSVSDEQPRILYDAFAQAVPALASDTPGHRTAVIPGQTGVRFAPGDPDALLSAITSVRTDDLRRMGLTALGDMQAHTHRAMHLARASALAEVLPEATL